MPKNLLRHGKPSGVHPTNAGLARNPKKKIIEPREARGRPDTKVSKFKTVRREFFENRATVFKKAAFSLNG